MKKYLLQSFTLLSAMLLFFPALAVAEALPARDNSQKLIITEVKIKTDSSFDEFIELYNASGEDIELSDYQLEYFNNYDIALATTNKGPTDLPVGKLAANSYYILAHNQAQITDSGGLNLFTDSLKDSTGMLRLWGPDLAGSSAPKIIQEQLAWASAVTPPEGVQSVGLSSNTLSKSQSLQRHTDELGNYTSDNILWSLEEPHPISSALVLPPPIIEEPSIVVIEESTYTEQPETGETVVEQSTETQSAFSQVLLSLVLNELSPNPASPLTDSLDEFVEIYNPNDQAVELDGYKVQTGNTYSYSYEFSSVSIAAHGYLTLTSGNTNLALANTGGKARLIDPNGVTVSETAPYEEAGEGEAWALVGGSWQWTTSPTPGSDNILTKLVPVVKAPVKKSPTIKKTPIAKKASAKKVSAKISSAKKSAVKSAATARDDETDPPMIMPLHTGVLAAVGVFALVYAGYEYRQDMANQLYRFSRYRETRRAARAASSGRRSH